MVNLLGLLMVWILLTGASPSMKVEVHLDMLTVHVRDAALSQVLEAIGEQADLKFIAIGEHSIEDAHVSNDFTNLSIEQGISRLLAGWDYALIRDKETMRPKEVYIIARMGKEVSSSIEQIEALSHIDDFQDAQALEILGKALQSTKPEVRLAALEIMVVENVRDRATLDVTRQLSISDPHPEVRGKALNIVRQYGPIRAESRESPDAN